MDQGPLGCVGQQSPCEILRVDHCGQETAGSREISVEEAVRSRSAGAGGSVNECALAKICMSREGQQVQRLPDSCASPVSSQGRRKGTERRVAILFRAA